MLNPFWTIIHHVSLACYSLQLVPLTGVDRTLGVTTRPFVTTPAVWQIKAPVVNTGKLTNDNNRLSSKISSKSVELI